ncbi:hypothetical protein [Paenibacillus sp.]|uniref:hypothetical protein n=1 Tax=Paenibacillus sp. TaxID=58172 RepID=UPI002D50DC7C|nr:hypothetical protein [Paenibacillus sp.]HZG88375.1 hypothetical protein [Paenibacillus sp.]
MYSSVANHLFHLVHYAFAWWLLLIVVPKLIFRTAYEDRLETLAAGALKAACLYMALGYLLVVTKLFEVLAIMGILVFLILRSYIAPKKDKGVDVYTAIGARFYDLVEIAFRLKLEWKYMLGRKVWTDKRLTVRRMSPAKLIAVGLFLAAMGMAAYVRWYDPLHSAAPSMSDGAVILLWTKYIIQRELFVGGIYPQGQFIFMAFIQKFAQIDTLYVVKYFGATSTCLIAAGLYFVVSRWTGGGRIAAVAAAAAYGLAGQPLHGVGDAWARQAATLPQEFALLFLLPTLYFFSKYFANGNRQDLWTGAAGCAVMGFTHFISFGYAGLGLGLLMLMALFQGREGVSKFWIGAATGIACVVVVFIPIVYGMLFGAGLHSTSSEFLLAQAQFTPPPLNRWDYAGLVSLAVVALAALFGRRDRRFAYGFVVLFVALCFFLYWYGGTLTQNVVIQTRSDAAWTVATCLALGVAWHAAASALFRSKERLRFVAECLAAAAAIAFWALSIRLTPIIPYKMMWDSAAEQYLEMAKRHYDNTWIVFSQVEGYSLSLGNGRHQYISTLISEFEPQAFPLTRRDQIAPDPNVSYHIYIVEEKEVFRHDPNSVIYESMVPDYARREAEYAELREWLSEYQSFNKDLQVFYEDDKVKIYYIYRGVPEEKKAELVWDKPIFSDLLKNLTE